MVHVAPEEPRRDVVKKVRMTPAEAHLLASLAEQSGKTESEVLRHGVNLVAHLEARRRGIERLIDSLAPGEQPPEKWEGRW